MAFLLTSWQCGDAGHSFVSTVTWWIILFADTLLTLVKQAENVTMQPFSNSDNYSDRVLSLHTYMRGIMSSSAKRAVLMD